MKVKIKETFNNRYIKFFVALLLLATVDFFFFFDNKIIPQNTTVMAFSYKYGFISRGFMGTFLQIWDQHTWLDITCYHVVWCISMAASVTFIGMLLVWFGMCIYKTWKAHSDCENILKGLIYATAIIAFPEFLIKENYGRLDVYLNLIMLFCMMLILLERFEWMIVPLSAVAMMIHQGYVFTNVNILLVLLFYKAVKYEGKQRKKYGVIFALTFITVSVLVLYFELFSPKMGAESYNDIVALARSMSMDGWSVSDNVLNHEVLGESVFELEWPYHIMNYKTLPLFLFMFLPLLIVIVHFFRGVWKHATDTRQRLMYFAVLSGAATLLPEMILKIDYGRYAYMALFYYLAVTISLVAMGDEVIIGQLKATYAYVQSKMLSPAILFLYMMLMMPFRDVTIVDNVTYLLKYIFGASL